MSKRSRVLSMFGGKCAYCGEIPSDDLGVDHIIPRSKGGSNAEENLLPCCRTCNSIKGTKLLDEFILYMDYLDLARGKGFTIKQLDFLISNSRFEEDFPRKGYIPYFIRIENMWK